MNHNFPNIMNKLLERVDLQEEEAAYAMEEIMRGSINNSQIAAFLTALKMKGESVKEIAAFARTMRNNSIRITPEKDHMIDTAGTGGDGTKTFNISTCAAIVAAGAGAKVAKHGNRASSSKSGSADVLEELGVPIITDPEKAKAQLEHIGFAFLFAPSFHPAMKHVAKIRKELGFKSVFNILGPLTNPAGAKRQLIGVYDKSLLRKMAEVAAQLGTEKTLIVSSDLDEISISEPTNVFEVHGNGIKEYTISPEDFDISRATIDTLRVDGKLQSAQVILDVLERKQGPARDIVLLNAGAALYVSGLAPSIKEGVELSEKSIDSGAAKEKLKQLRGA
jgi:anthranilate phosphoribosyltransferase